MEQITKEYLDEHPNYIFVFGDNVRRAGLGGGAVLRHHKQAYGFITKKAPCQADSCYYEPDEYYNVYQKEMDLLKAKIKANPDKIFLITKLGAGLANKFKIFEEIIEPNIKNDLKGFKNVVFLW